VRGKKLFAACYMVFLSAYAGAQEISTPLQVSTELNFANYLIRQQLPEEALHFLGKMDESPVPTAVQRDSIHHLMGLLLYERLETGHYNSTNTIYNSAFHLAHVSPSSPFYITDKLRQSWVYANLGNSGDAIKLLNDLPGDSQVNTLKLFELSGNYLLSRKYTEYERIAGELSRSPLLLTERESMAISALQLKQAPRHSMLLAGTLSAIVPGSGKIYAGKTMQGLSTLLHCGLLGLMAYENGRRAGFDSPRFIVYGSIFTLFYAGNIWGSVLSVKIRKDEYFQKIDSQILLDLRVPLRSSWK
jgi:hypothetical protein